MAFDTFDTDPFCASLITYSNGNLTATANYAFSFTNSGLAQTFEGKTSGKWFVSFTYNTAGGAGDAVGATNSVGISGHTNNGYLGGFSSISIDNNVGFLSNGAIYVNGAEAYGYAGYGVGDIIDMAIDITNSLVWFRVNGGSWLGSNNTTADPATGTAGVGVGFFPADFRVFAAVNMAGSATRFTANFGATAFTYAAPAGFTAGWTNTTAGSYFGSFLTNGPGDYTNTPVNNTQVAKYLCSVSGNLGSLVLPVPAGAFTSVGVIYADSSGAPGSLLGTSTPQSGGGAEISFPFSGVTVSSGTSYWIGYMVGSTPFGDPIYAPLGTTIGQYTSTTGTYPNPPNPFVSSASHLTHIPMIANIVSSVTPVEGALTLTGYAPTDKLTMTPAEGALVITGYSPLFSSAPGLGQLKLTGYAPHFIPTPPLRRIASVRWL